MRDCLAESILQFLQLALTGTEQPEIKIRQRRLHGPAHFVHVRLGLIDVQQSSDDFTRQLVLLHVLEGSGRVGS